MWKRQFGGPGAEKPDRYALDLNSNAIIVGTTTGALAGANAGSQDAFIAECVP